MKLANLLVVSTCLLPCASLHAQDVDMEAIQDNISIFTGILEESLELGQSTGLFGMQLGGVEGVYLHGQGVLFDIKTPLANKRNSVGLASLSSALQSLQSRPNPFASSRSTSAVLASSSAAGAQGQEGASTVYDDMMERIANVDFSIVANTAIQQASEAARSLRNLGSMNRDDYDRLERELAELRAQTEAKLLEFRELSNSLKEAGQVEASSDSDDSFDLKAEFDGLLAGIEPLKQQVVAKASDLKARSQLAQESFTAQLALDIADFESKVFSAFCDYGGTLKQLPADERITIQLQGLGGDARDNEKSNQLFVMQKQDLLRCQSGEINAEALMLGAVSYSY